MLTDTDRESLLRFSEIEYASGGLLSVVDEENPGSAHIRVPKKN